MAGIAAALTAVAKVAVGGTEVLKISIGTTDVWSAVTFLPSGMNKSGTHSFTTAWAQVTGWTADTANYAGSTVVSNALQAQGGKTNATITASLPFTGTTTSLSKQARVLVNGVVVATGTSVTSASGTLTVTATGVTLVDGDDVTVQVICNSFASGSISATAYVRIT